MLVSSIVQEVCRVSMEVFAFMEGLRAGVLRGCFEKKDPKGFRNRGTWRTSDQKVSPDAPKVTSVSSWSSAPGSCRATKSSGRCQRKKWTYQNIPDIPSQKKTQL